MNDVKLSASRIKTAQGCSWKYWANYKLKLPQKGNDGSNRGTICHDIFETLGSDEYLDEYKKILDSGTVMGSEKMSKTLLDHAKELKVDDEENIELMDMMIMRGLLFDFFGDEEAKPTEAISEKEFNIEINEQGKKYKIRGFIDKLFLYSKEKRAVIRDFKTSKQLFKGKEITDNLQDLMYCLAVKHLYPEYTDRDVEFVFLKFDLEKDLLGARGRGLLKMNKLSEDELDGFEYQLSGIQEYLENFNEDDAKSNFAANQSYPSDGTFGGPLMCGKEGFKQSRGELVLNDQGEKIPNFICEHRKPMVYYVLLNENKEILSSAFEENKDKLIPDKSKGQKVQKKFYDGCPHFFGDAFEL